MEGRQFLGVAQGTSAFRERAARDTELQVKLTLHVWRQVNATAPGAFETYAADDVSPDMSFLEMLDIVNESLMNQRKEPIAFDHDCCEGICGMCGLMINGVAH